MTLGARLAQVPAKATIRGMFMRQACAWVPSTASTRYLPFSTYPLAAYMATLMKAAATRYPSEAPADALVALGLEVYPLFASSLVGSTIFGIANNAFRHVVELSPRAYPITISPAHVNVLRCESGFAQVELRRVWPFPEFFHAGIWLGAMNACKVQGTITVIRRSECDADFSVEWSSKLS
jgi:uncharacterized protein (TIGR02265 family)